MNPKFHFIIILLCFTSTESLFFEDLQAIKSYIMQNPQFDQQYQKVLYDRHESFLTDIFQSDTMKRVANFESFIESGKNNMILKAKYYHSKTGRAQEARSFDAQIRILPDPNQDHFHGFLAHATMSGFICNVKVDSTHFKQFNYMYHEPTSTAWACFSQQLKPESENIAFFFETSHIVTSEGYALTIVIEEFQAINLNSPIFIGQPNQKQKPANSEFLFKLFLDMARAVMNLNQNFYLHGSIAPWKFILNKGRSDSLPKAKLTGFENAVDYEMQTMFFRSGMHYSSNYQSPSLVFVQNQTVKIPFQKYEFKKIDGYAFTPDMKEDVYALASSIIQIYNLNSAFLDPADPKMDLLFRYLQSWVINLAQSNIEQVPDSEELYGLMEKISNGDQDLPDIDRMARFDNRPKQKKEIQTAEIIIVDKQMGTNTSQQDQKVRKALKNLKRFRHRCTVQNKLGIF